MAHDVRVHHEVVRRGQEGRGARAQLRSHRGAPAGDAEEAVEAGKRAEQRRLRHRPMAIQTKGLSKALKRPLEADEMSETAGSRWGCKGFG